MEAFCEHTSHHPPVSNFLILGNGFKIYGNNELFGRFKKNSLVGTILGTNNIEFADGQKINFNFPSMISGGMIFGHRNIIITGEMEFSDNLGNKAVVKIGPARKKSFFKKAIGKKSDYSGSITDKDGNQVEV